MRERWLQSLWGKQDWNDWPLRTCQGQSIRVLHPGKWNNDQGPDFIGAQIFIDQVLWVGAVEIHVHAADWFRHHHPTDPNYLPVILHVVWMQVPLHPDIPTLELSRYLTVPKLKQTLIHLGDISELACHRVMKPVPDPVWIAWRSHLLSIRRHRKRTQLNHGVTSFRSALARQMGAWVNREVFESIDASISDDLLQAVRPCAEDLTALYLGQAGLLEEAFTEDPLLDLQVRYRQIRQQFSLNPPYRSLLWMRIRPAATPTIRLVQLAALIHRGWHEPFRWQGQSHLEIAASLSQLELEDPWRVDEKICFSAALIENLLINLWCYQPGLHLEDTEKVLALFSYEENRITRQYPRLEIKDPSAADSQALLELNQSYCLSSRCSTCALANCWIQDQAPQSI